jgi:pyridoxal phosphate enzyme (YggS family)
MSVHHNLDLVRARIASACAKSERPNDAVRLLLATKLQPPVVLREAVDAGATLFGENRVQEALTKVDELRDLDITWHFIGHLQSNKVRDVLQFASCVESVDKLSLAMALDKELQRRGTSVDVFVEVNTSAEASKHGVAPAELRTLLAAVKGLDTLRVRGLMTIGALSDDGAVVKRCFAMLRDLRDDARDSDLLPEDAELSMGMSSDLELAIEEGATIVRVGSAVFGQR